MSDICVGVIGRILQGNELGHYIKVQDDSENSGGYLIHTSEDFEFKKSYDGWVEKEHLDEYFNEAGWKVEWLDNLPQKL